MIPSSWQGMRLIKSWDYRVGDHTIGSVARYESTEGQKAVIPFFRSDGKAGKAEDSCISLYGTVDTRCTFVVEGEKCVDAMNQLGLAAVTSQGGSAAALKSDWILMRDVETVFLIPDRDDSGTKYIQDAISILQEQDPGRVIKVLELDDLSEKGDIVDWIQARIPDWDGYQADDRIALLKPELRSLAKNCYSVRAETGDNWPLLEQLPDPIPPVAVFDYGLLPEKLRPYIEECVSSLQCPPEFLATASMVALASLIGRQVCIRPKKHENWSVVANLWGANVGLSAQKKTPAQDKAFKPLLKLDQCAQEAFKQEGKEQISAHYQREAEIKTLKKQLDSHYHKPDKSRIDPADIGRQIVELEAQEEAIQVRRYWTSDATIEKLTELLSHNPNGMLIKRDELMGWLKTLERAGHEGDRAFYLESHSGDGTAYHDRIGRGTTHCAGICLSIHGSIQPGPLQSYVSEATGGNQGADGLLQRFQLMVWPDPVKNWKYIDSPNDPTAYSLAQSVFDRLDCLSGEGIGAIQPEDGLPFLKFTEDAQQLYIRWTTDLNQRVLAAEEHPALLSHLGKFESLMPSLALILHLADGHVGPVSVTAAAKAADWCEFLESHARRIYASCERPELQAAHLLAKKIQSGAVTSKMTIRETYRKGWSGLTTSHLVKIAAEVLEEYGWLRVFKIETDGAPSFVIELHPDLIKPIPEGT